MRPSLSYKPHDRERPFHLTVPWQPIGFDHTTELTLDLSLADARLLRKDIERAEQEDSECRLCLGDHHVFVLADAQPILPAGAVSVVCKHCPATGVLEPDQSVVPVGEGQ